MSDPKKAANDAAMLALIQQRIATLSTTPAPPVEKEHKFWSTQPVPQQNAVVEESGPIEVKTVADVSKTPYPLPTGFEWSNVDLLDTAQSSEVYKLLTENYVEDDDNMFRFDYSESFLRWALTPPHFEPDYHIGVRLTSTRKLVGFITGIPQQMSVYDESKPMVEINYLCVHKKLRSKRLAPVLIKEVTRRVNLRNVWQAVYTAGVVLPKPVATTRYWHRSLQVKKLIEVGFTRLQRNMTMMRTIKLYKLDDKPLIKGIRAMQQSDVPNVHSFLMQYLSKQKLHPVFTEEEIAHWLLPRNDVIYSYVVYENDKLTGFTSFYNLPSSILGHAQHNHLKAAYSFYNVCASNKFNLTQLMNDALIFAVQEGFDVFNALDVMQNDEFFKELKFGPGDGYLQYYLYNWKCPQMKPQEVGLVLL